MVECNRVTIPTPYTVEAEATLSSAPSEMGSDFLSKFVFRVGVRILSSAGLRPRHCRKQ